MNWIISANYRDRKSPKKWLVRRASQPIEAAVAVDAVFATSVSFVESGEEAGFGCAIIAEARTIHCRHDEINCNDLPPTADKLAPATLAFDGHVFHWKDQPLDRFGDHVGVNYVNQLLLNSNGTMQAA